MPHDLEEFWRGSGRAVHDVAGRQHDASALNRGGQVLKRGASAMCAGAGRSRHALTIDVALVTDRQAMFEQRFAQLKDASARADTSGLGFGVDGFDALPTVECEQHAVGGCDTGVGVRCANSSHRHLGDGSSGYGLDDVGLRGWGHDRHR